MKTQNTKEDAKNFIYAMDRDINTNPNSADHYKKKLLDIIMEVLDKEYEKSKDTAVYMPIPNEIETIMDTTLSLTERQNLLSKYLIKKAI